MCANKTGKKPGLLRSVLFNKCPHCRKGNLFVNPNPYNLKTTMKMPEHCPVCGQRYELQAGFYFGTGYVSYFLSVFFILFSFFLWYFTLGISLNDDSIYWWLGTVSVLLLLLQPVLQRLGRSIWIACFVRYESDWKLE